MMLVASLDLHLRHVPLDVNGNTRLSIFSSDLEWEVLDVTLEVLVVVLASNKTLDVEDGAVWVRGVLVLGWRIYQLLSLPAHVPRVHTGVSDQSLVVVPSDI